MFHKTAIGAAAFLLITPQVAVAAEIPCLTAQETTALATYAMPSVITSTTQRCSASLGKESWIARNGEQMAQRYAANKAGAWPVAKAALLKLSGSSNDQMLSMMKTLPDNTLQELADTLVSGSVAEQIKTARCGVIDRFMALISPLPPENTTELIALTLGILSQGEKPKLGKLAVCKA